MKSPNPIPAERELPHSAARRAELLALLPLADTQVSEPPTARRRIPDRLVPPRRVLLPLAAAATVAGLVTGVLLGVSDDDRATRIPGPAGPPSAVPSATVPTPPVVDRTLPPGQVPVPAEVAVPDAEAGRFVAACAASRLDPATASGYRPYFTVRSPRAADPGHVYAVAVDPSGRHALQCSGSASPTAQWVQSDFELLTGTVQVDNSGGTKSGSAWTDYAAGRYNAPVARVTMDRGTGERSAIMSGGVWYAAETVGYTREAAEAFQAGRFPRIRGYDAAGKLIWDSARDIPEPGSAECVRTPDGRVLDYKGHAEPDPATCRPALPWTAGNR
ncbi:hypothetical protein B4N89_30390 [Embleya scabrispora]|uniref:Uncharacterized protein n=1 Tax=Embleya scabrispora TaxID=159449 RepID=A0A1T3P6F1_9ACTN|nr:hypothetical protein [Embleya scabrispora]OPC84656.1 hypothetical protein B4N89_30390 [Embleya scabrispora]